MFPLRDSHPSRKFPFINLVLIAVNIYVFFLELTAPNTQAFIESYALIPASVNLAVPQTLLPFVTSMFFHAGFLHILSNMWFLWIFGDNVEGEIGHIKYLFFYLFAGIAASFVQYIFISSSVLPMIGASGAIAGVLGAYYKFFPHHKVDSLLPVFGFPVIVAIPASFMLIYWFVIQAFSGAAGILSNTASTGGVAYLAHAGGFLAGLIFSPFFVWKNQRY